MDSSEPNKEENVVAFPEKQADVKPLVHKMLGVPGSQLVFVTFVKEDFELKRSLALENFSKALKIVYDSFETTLDEYRELSDEIKDVIKVHLVLAADFGPQPLEDSEPSFHAIDTFLPPDDNP